jgi:hypothetical protein
MPGIGWYGRVDRTPRTAHHEAGRAVAALAAAARTIALAPDGAAVRDALDRDDLTGRGRGSKRQLFTGS